MLYIDATTDTATRSMARTDQCHLRDLRDLPDPAAALVATFLDARALHALVRCGLRDVPRPLALAFQRTWQLRLPPDTARNARLAQMLQCHRQCHRRDRHGDDNNDDDVPPLVLPTRFAVVDTQHAAAALLPQHRCHVQGLTLSANEYTAWPAQPFAWHVVAQFVSLETLAIDYAWDVPLDLVALARSAPRLHVLVLKRARAIRHDVRMALPLPRLRVLHLAVGLPALQSLTLLTTPQCYTPLRDVAQLAHVAPLTRLVVRGLWKSSPSASLRVHTATLRTYVELDDTRGEPNMRTRRPAWFTLTHLRSLSMGRFAQRDTRPLTALVALEHLQLKIAANVTHCRPLRQLTQLRELRIANGWVCDLVGWMPRLETLVWEDNGDPYSATRMRLFCRDTGVAEAVAVAPSRLRRLVLRGQLHVDTRCHVVRAMGEYIEQLEVHEHNAVDALFEWIATLGHVKRLFFRLTRGVPFEATRRAAAAAADGSDNGSGSGHALRLASAATLEELYVHPRYIFDSAVRPRVPLPRLVYDEHLPRLRVLASPCHESLVALASLCPRLTELHVPFSTECAFAEASRSSLGRLCVVSLAVDYDCTWLRREMGHGRALPSLRRIFHPTTDCLSAPVCRRHETFVAVNGEGFTARRVLVPAWGHVWEAMEWDVVDDHYHAVIPEGYYPATRGSSETDA